MDRRKALGNIGKGIGTIIVTPSIVSIFQRCQSSKTFNPTFFKSEDFNLISRLMEIIIPKCFQLFQMVLKQLVIKPLEKIK